MSIKFKTILMVIFCLLFFPIGFRAIAANVRIAMVQYQVDDDDAVGTDDDQVEAYIRTAANDDAQIVVVPENCFYRYGPWEQNGVTMLDLANEYNMLHARFAGLAAELNICIVIGLREPSGDSLKPVYNTALFSDRMGRNLASIINWRHRSRSFLGQKPARVRWLSTPPTGVSVCLFAKT